MRRRKGASCNGRCPVHTATGLTAAVFVTGPIEFKQSGLQTNARYPFARLLWLVTSKWVITYILRCYLVSNQLCWS